MRPAFRGMATRLAESGYAVLVVNPFYRDARAPVVSEGASFQDPETRAKILPYARRLSAETHFTDAAAFMAFLDAQDGVDIKRKAATMGIDFSPGALMAMIVFSIAGLVFFKRGKKSGPVSHMVYGALLLIYPYFVTEFLPMLLIGLALLAMAYFVRFG